METVSDFIFGGSKITADGDCSHEIERRLLLGRKVIFNLDSIFKRRDITLPTKVRLVKAMVFPVVMYGCESWTVRKAEHRRIDAFEKKVDQAQWLVFQLTIFFLLSTPKLDQLSFQSLKRVSILLRVRSKVLKMTQKVL